MAARSRPASPPCAAMPRSSYSSTEMAAILRSAFRIWCLRSQPGSAVFALGSRVRGAREPGSLSPQQLLAGHVGGLLLRLVYGAGFTDLSPFRAIRCDELRRLGMKEETYGWNLEMLMRVAAVRLPALEISVGQRRRIGGVSKVSGNLVAGIKAALSISTTFIRLAFELRGETSRTR